MKYIIVLVLFLGILLSIGSFDALAYTRVKGYTKSNGTYVQPYYRSNTNRMKYDNWSTKGNINPFNWKRGYKNIWK